MAGEREVGELTHFSTFSGIEGVGIAAELAGFKSIGQVEINPFSLKILNKRYPDVPKWGDIRNVTKESVKAAGIRTINLLSGGFPCQDLSVAGKQAGLEGERSGLWFEMLRVISELRPRWVIAENVRGAVNLALDTVKMGMEGEGYKVWPFVLPASAFGAPHRRERLFVVGCREDVANAYSTRDRTPENRANGDRQEGNEGREEQSQSQSSGHGKVDGMMWPTPSVCGNYNRKGASPNSGDGLATAVKMWPTPKATLRGDCPSERKRRSPDLHAAVKLEQKGDKQNDEKDATGSREILRELRIKIREKKIHQLNRRHGTLSQEEILQPSVCRDCSEERRPRKVSTSKKSGSLPKRNLRTMRIIRYVGGTSFRRERKERIAEQSNNTLCQLSYQMALETRKNSESKEGHKVFHLRKGRKDKDGNVPKALSKNKEVWGSNANKEEATGRAAQNNSGQLSADWVEILMGFPIGWTNPDVDEPEPWPGWPAPMGAKMWATPAVWDCQGASGGGQGRSLRTDIYNIKHGLTEAGQYPYEPPRVAKGIKNRADRIKALGNAVVPAQCYPILKAIADIERGFVK